MTDPIHSWCMEQTLYQLENREQLTSEDIYVVVEQVMRDWDLYGPRLTDYDPTKYELTDTQWEDISYSVRELVEDKLSHLVTVE